MRIPKRAELAAAIEADRETGMPVDWSATPFDPEATYWHVWHEGGRQAGFYASEARALEAIAEQVYGAGDSLQARYRLEPPSTRIDLARQFARNSAALAAEYEVRPCRGRDHGM